MSLEEGKYGQRFPARGREEEKVRLTGSDMNGIWCRSVSRYLACHHHGVNGHRGEYCKAGAKYKGGAIHASELLQIIGHEPPSSIYLESCRY